MHIDRAGFALKVDTPECVKELLTADRDVFVLAQKQQAVKLHRFKRDFDFVLFYDSFLWKNFHITDAQHILGWPVAFQHIFHAHAFRMA